MKKMKERFFRWVNYAWTEAKLRGVKIYKIIKPVNTIWSFALRIYKLIKILIGFLVAWKASFLVEFYEIKRAILLIIHALS